MVLSSMPKGEIFGNMLSLMEKEKEKEMEKIGKGN